MEYGKNASLRMVQNLDQSDQAVLMLIHLELCNSHEVDS
jgi:hypothetical protein